MKNLITAGEKYGPAMKIANQEDANAYLEECIQHQMRIGNYSRDEATEIELSNIGYIAGYYDKETYARVMKLYATHHPIFGRVYPEFTDSFDTGLSDGESSK